ncbi:acyl-CoA thioesterase [Xanthobacter sp. TB0139]|uniref:acyl-CoA thioesterase n=1 Tax=Xanthobacter sp. TB0139 TaxID=3459178 RepID=UPI004039B351
MNLWLRFLRVLIGTRFGPRLALPFGVSTLTLRVWPNDLDLNMHLNNGRYLSMMDLGRVDLMARGGVLKFIFSRRWMPVLAEAQVHYRRSLAPFQRFRLETRISGWRDHSIFLKQQFVIISGPQAGEVAATAIVRAVLVQRGAVPEKVPVAEIFRLIGVEAPEAYEDASAEGASFQPALQSRAG